MIAPTERLRRHWDVLLLCLIGIAERAVWIMIRPGGGSGSEATRVAEALAAGRGFADAYRVGQGPTAHLLPISPGIAGAVYWLLGIESPAAQFLLTCWSIGLNIGLYLLLYRAFAHLGVPRRLRLLGLAWGMVAAVYIATEVDAFRIWEGGLANFLAALFLERLLARRRALAAVPRERRRYPLRLAACASLLFFVNPPLGLAAYACLLVFGLERFAMRQNLAGAAVAAAVLALFVVPWTIRNDHAVGVPVPLRSNAGLEFALANNAEMADSHDERLSFTRMLQRIHPTASDAAYREVQRIGEVAYANRLGARAKRWVADHPAAAARLWAHHFKEIFLPSAWKLAEVPGSRVGLIRTILAQLTGVLGLLGFGYLALRRVPGLAYPGVMIFLTALLMSPFLVVARYCCLDYAFMCFLAPALLMAVPKPTSI
jgi:hypothetical protein